MKKTLTLLGLFITATLFGQTTLKEYNYVTKGIQVALDAGLDMKEGYELRNVGQTTVTDLFSNWSSEDRNEMVGFHILIREDGTVASYLLTHNGSVGNHDFIQILCIPTGKTDAEIMNLAKSQFFKDDEYKSQTDGARYWAFIELMIPFLDSIDWSKVEYEEWVDFD